MLQFQNFLSEAADKAIATRSEKAGRAVDEEVFVVVANAAAKIRRKNPKITREDLIKRVRKEVEKAKANPSHELSYKNAEPNSFFGKSKTGANSKTSWHDQLDIATDSLATTINHKDFTPYWNKPSGFKAFRLGNALGDLSEKWKVRGLGGATRTPKTDIAFTAEGIKGLFTASLKDETGGVLITSAAGETGAIMEHAFEDILPHLKSSMHDEVNGVAYKHIGQIEKWMANDANAEKANKAIWKLVDHLNELGPAGEPPVPLGEHFLRNVYREALTGEHKFEDNKSIVSHLLKLASGDKSKFQNVDEHLKPMYKPDKDGFMFSMSRSNDPRYNSNYARIGFGKHGLRGAQPAAFRVYPMKVDLQKGDWLKIQDNHVLNGDFDSFKNEFGYKISHDEIKNHWNRRIKALATAQKTTSAADYQEAVGYKATKDEVKDRLKLEVPEPKKVSPPKVPVPARPIQNKSFAGGGDVSYTSPAEEEIYNIPPEPGEDRPANQTMKAASKAATEVAKKQPKPGLISKMGAMAQSAMQKAKGQKPQPTETQTREKFDWSGVEKDYTTTNASVEKIASAHGISPDEVSSHAWSNKLRRPARRAAI